MNSPCKGCADRAVGCHGRCEKYLAFDAERVKIRLARQQEHLVRYAKIESVIAWKKQDTKRKK